MMEIFTENILTSQLGIPKPIIQAPMAGYTTPELISAVSNEGCLGSLGAGYMSPEAIDQSISEIKKLTSSPYAVNLFIPGQVRGGREDIKQMQSIIEKIPITPSIIESSNISPPYTPSFDEQMEVVIAHKVPVFSFTFGLLESGYIKKLKANGTFIIGTATSISEAIALSETHVDAICVQGYEAGGHRGSFLNNHSSNMIGNLALIPQVVDRIKLPVIAAGGIMDSRGVKAVLTLGASAAQIGTGFLLCEEAGINSTYLKVLLAQDEDNTVITKCFSGKEARVVRNLFIDYMQPDEDKLLPYPIQNAITDPMRKRAKEEGNEQLLSLWAGQGTPIAHKTPLTVKEFISRCLR